MKGYLGATWGVLVNPDTVVIRTHLFLRLWHGAGLAASSSQPWIRYLLGHIHNIYIYIYTYLSIYLSIYICSKMYYDTLYYRL